MLRNMAGLGSRCSVGAYSLYGPSRSSGITNCPVYSFSHSFVGFDSRLVDSRVLVTSKIHTTRSYARWLRCECDRKCICLEPSKPLGSHEAGYTNHIITCLLQCNRISLVSSLWYQRTVDSVYWRFRIVDFETRVSWLRWSGPCPETRGINSTAPPLLHQEFGHLGSVLVFYLVIVYVYYVFV